MAESPLRIGPVAATGRVEIAATEGAAGRIGAALGLALANTPNRSITGGGLRADWIAPWRWLVRSAPGAEAALVARVDGVVHDDPRDAHVSVVVTDAWTGVEVSGDRAVDLLAEGCPLDLERLADAGALWCARTVLGRLPVMLAVPERRNGYEIWVDRAYSDYLARWLEAACGRVLD